MVDVEEARDARDATQITPLDPIETILVFQKPSLRSPRGNQIPEVPNANIGSNQFIT